MSRYLRTLTATLAIALLIAVATGGTPLTKADDGQSARFNLNEVEDITPATLPIGVSSAEKLVVMLKLSGDPVALVKAGKPGKQISDVERTGVKSALKANQDALLAAIAAAGGRVLGEYQSAINGICSTPRPRVVTAGVPIRIPDGSNGLRGSNGTVL